MNVQQISVRDINDPLFNSRLDENKGSAAELTDFGYELKRKQLQPIGVRTIPGANGSYRLIWGSRRLAAAKLVGMETIAAEVQTEGTEADEIIDNAIENLRRKDLTTFETARVCAELRSKGMKLDDVATKLGLSKGHVSNLTICFQLLPAEVKKAWKDEEAGADVSFLRSIVTKDVDGKKVNSSPEEMTAAWKERVESLTNVDGEEEEEDPDEDDDEADDDDGAPVPSAKYTVHKARYRALLQALRKGKAPQLAIDVARYLVGDIEKIRGVAIGDAKAPTKKTTNRETK